MKSKTISILGVLFILIACAPKAWAGDTLFPIRKTAQTLKITYTENGPLREENRRLVKKATDAAPRKRLAIRATDIRGGGGYIDEFDVRGVRTLKIRLGSSIQWIDVSYPDSPIESFDHDGLPIRD
jgi:hypothetical protein